MTSAATRNGLEAWVSFLRAHAAITRQLNADLLNAHGLTLSDYEVLLHLSRAEGQMMRRVDDLHAARVQLGEAEFRKLSVPVPKPRSSRS